MIKVRFTCPYIKKNIMLLDVDECLPGGTNDCSPNATCANTAGSYQCTCKDGFTGNGQTCTGKTQTALKTYQTHLVKKSSYSLYIIIHIPYGKGLLCMHNININILLF